MPKTGKLCVEELLAYDLQSNELSKFPVNEDQTTECQRQKADFANEAILSLLQSSKLGNTETGRPSRISFPDWDYLSQNPQWKKKTICIIPA